MSWKGLAPTRTSPASRGDGDNAAMASFFALLQWTTREELRIAIVTWIERTYHHPLAPGS